jgi:hypothetical protein
VLFSRNRPRAEQCKPKMGEIYVLGFIVVAGGSWFCVGAKGKGGFLVGCRVLGRVRWKRRKGLDEWECGVSVGGGLLHPVIGTLILKCDKYEMEQMFKNSRRPIHQRFPQLRWEGIGFGMEVERGRSRCMPECF